MRIIIIMNDPLISAELNQSIILLVTLNEWK